MKQVNNNTPYFFITNSMIEWSFRNQFDKFGQNQSSVKKIPGFKFFGDDALQMCT